MKEIKLDMLSSPGCHNCEVFLAFWETEKSKWPNVKFSHNSVTEPAGLELAQKHMIMSSPGIILNDEVFSMGGVNQKEFIKKLEELSKE